MSISSNLQNIKVNIPANVSLIAVSKTYAADKIQEAYTAGHRLFGENKVQELVGKYEELPKDIEWHLIGHLQTNKVKYIAPFVSLIHSVDSEKLLLEINKQGEKNKRIINCLLQIYIAQEDTKFGLSFDEADTLINSLQTLPYVNVCGLMAMASNTNNTDIIRKEFLSLHNYYKQKQSSLSHFTILSMGMSSDYQLAIECGSNMIRVGSSIFGLRQNHGN